MSWRIVIVLAGMNNSLKRLVLVKGGSVYFLHYLNIVDST